MPGRIHRSQSVTLLWLAYRIGVLNSVARWCNTTHFLQKSCNYTWLCAWASEGFFPGVALVDFSKSFSRGVKSGKICLLPLETKKTAYFA